VVEAFGNLGAGSPAASPVSSTPTALLPVEAEVALGDLFYAPCAVTFPANVPSTLTLTNENGAATGNVVIDSLNVRSAYVAPGETTDVAIDAPAGVYVFYSDAPNQRAAGRAGILIVQGDATPTP
jgi:FtsP/CotA-like multicopper oxidase with cupredoxin domain